MKICINVNIHVLKYLLSSVTPGRIMKVVNHLDSDKEREDPAFKVVNVENKDSSAARMSSRTVVNTDMANNSFQNRAT